MGMKSKRKGSNFERFLSRELSEWWYQDNSILRRVPLSGGWDAAALGDVMVPPAYIGKVPKFPFYVEARNREGWDFSELYDVDRNSALKKWWAETLTKAKVPKQIPLLVFSRAYQPTYVLFDPAMDLTDTNFGYTPFSPYLITRILLIDEQEADFHESVVHIMELKHFFSCVKREEAPDDRTESGTESATEPRVETRP